MDNSSQELIPVDKSSLRYYNQKSKAEEELLPLLKELIKYSKSSSYSLEDIEVGQRLTWWDLAYLFVVNLLLCLLILPIFFGFYSLKPGQYLIIMACGKCLRLWSNPGLYWFPPSVTCIVGSSRLYSRTINKMIIPDGMGSPVKISVMVTSNIIKPLMSHYGCVKLNSFIKANLRELLMKFIAKIPFQSHPGVPSLQTHSIALCDLLRQALQNRMKSFGVEIVRVQITEMAYLPEVAAGLLQIQQARAKLEARKTIVHGSVGIVVDLIKNSSQFDLNANQDVSDQLAKSLLTTLCSNYGHPRTVLMLD